MRPLLSGIPNPRIPYPQIVHRLQSLSWGHLQVMGTVSGYPLLSWSHKSSTRTASIGLSAGIHGDEPAGVETILKLLEDCPDWLRRWDLTIFPCLNPWGYEHNLRLNEKGADLNRDWKKPVHQEIRLAQKILGRSPLDLTLCLHEDYDATGLYLYEVTKQPKRMGPQIIRKVSQIIPTERRLKIEGRVASGGVVVRDPILLRRRQHWPEALYHHAHITRHSLTLETPTHFPIHRRVQAHTTAIRTALSLLLK